MIVEPFANQLHDKMAVRVTTISTVQVAALNVACPIRETLTQRYTAGVVQNRAGLVQIR